MSGSRSASLVRPSVEVLNAYVPGEQPQGDGWIKLNTNENWFVAPSVLASVAKAATAYLRRYPDPVFSELRARLEARYGVPASQIICGNGSDEILTLLIRACAGEGDRIAFGEPSYSLYETLAQIQNAAPVGVPMGEAWELPVDGLIAVGAPLTLVTTPHAPSGTPFALADLEKVLWLFHKKDAAVAQYSALIVDGFSEAARRELQEITTLAASGESKKPRDKDQAQLADYGLKNNRTLLRAEILDHFANIISISNQICKSVLN